MKKACAFLGIALLLSSLYSPETKTLVAIETKVAGVEIEKLMNLEKPEECIHEWRDLVKDLQKKLEEAEKKLKDDGQKLEKEYKEYEELNKSRATSDDAKKKKTEAVMKLQTEYQTNVQYVNEFRMKAIQSIQANIFEKVKKVAQELGKKQGWDQINFGGVLYLSDRCNLTEELRKALDKDYDAQQAKMKETAKTEKAAETKPVAKPAAK